MAIPLPGDLPDPGIKLMSLSLLPWQEDSVPLVPPRKPPVRIAATKKTTNNKCWGGCEEMVTLMHC